MSPNSTVMFHEGMAMEMGRATDVKKFYKVSEVLLDKVYQLLADKTKEDIDFENFTSRYLFNSRGMYKIRSGWMKLSDNYSSMENDNILEANLLLEKDTITTKVPN